MPKLWKINLGLYFAAIAALLFLAVTAGKTTLDVHLRDSYYVFPASYLFKIPALMLVVISLLYLLTRRMVRTNSLMLIHTIGTLALLAWVLPEIHTNGSRLAAADFNAFEKAVARFRLHEAIVQLLLWWQLLLPLNWLLSRVKRRS